MRTTATVFLACVLPLGAQPSALPAPITLRGTVLEGGVNSPIANVSVTLDRPDLATRSAREQEKTTSAADGSFQFKIQTTGSFTVSASLKGYSGIAGTLGAISNVQRVFVEPQTKSPLDVRLILVRAATLTGKIVDFEKNIPIPGIPIRLMTISHSAGRLLRTSSAFAQTDESGQFEISSPSVGRFVLYAPDRPPFNQHITTELAPNEAPEEYGYEAPYWPGVEEVESALVFQLTSGSRVNAGTLALRQVPHYRARVSVRGADCGQDAPIAARISRMFQDRPRDILQEKQITCGQDFGLQALRPGRYQLEIFSRPDAIESRKRAKLFFEVTDRNQTLDAALTLGMNLSGMISAPQGFRDFEKLSVSVLAIDAVPLDPLGLINVGAKGAFVIPNLPQGLMYLQIHGIPQGFYVRKVRYNSREIESRVMFPFTSDGAGQLVIELDDQPATASGIIRGPEGNPANTARVILARWPLNPDLSLSIIGAAASEVGVFRITGLADAEYRIFAYGQNAAAMLDEPGRLEQVLSTAKRFSLKRGETQTLDLNLTDISR